MTDYARKVLTDADVSATPQPCQSSTHSGTTCTIEAGAWMNVVILK